MVWQKYPYEWAQQWLKQRHVESKRPGRPSLGEISNALASIARSTVATAGDEEGGPCPCTLCFHRRRYPNMPSEEVKDAYFRDLIATHGEKMTESESQTQWRKVSGWRCPHEEIPDLPTGSWSFWDRETGGNTIEALGRLGSAPRPKPDTSSSPKVETHIGALEPFGVPRHILRKVANKPEHGGLLVKRILTAEDFAEWVANGGLNSMEIRANDQDKAAVEAAIEKWKGDEE